MTLRYVCHLLGCFLFIISGLMIVPALIDFLHFDDSCVWFFSSFSLCLFVAGLFTFANRSDSQEEVLHTKYSILFVILSWIVLILASSLPFLCSSYNLSIIDCLFESCSIVTTTGGSLLNDYKISDGVIFWKSSLQVFGAIWSVVTLLGILSNLKIGGCYISKNDNFIYSFDQINFWRNLGIVSAIYVFLIACFSFVLTIFGIDGTQSLIYACSLISTSGIADSQYAVFSLPIFCQLIFIVLMFIGGMSIITLLNFIKRKNNIFKNDLEFKIYLLVIFSLFVLIAFIITYNDGIEFFHSIIKALFLSVSAITTNGFYMDVLHQSDFLKNSLLFLSTIIGGCYGSASGGFKIMRIAVIFIVIKNSILRILKSNSVFIPSYNSKRIEDVEVTSIVAYISCFLFLGVFLSICLSATGVDFSKAFYSVITSMTNSCIFLCSEKSTVCEILAVSEFSKIILMIAMVAGRVEFMLFFALCSRSFWKK